MGEEDDSSPSFFMFYNIFLRFFRLFSCTIEFFYIPLQQKSEKDVEYSSGRNRRGNAGVRPWRDNPDVKTYRKSAGEMLGAFTDFGLPAFPFIALTP